MKQLLLTLTLILCIECFHCDGDFIEDDDSSWNKELDHVQRNDRAGYYIPKVFGICVLCVAVSIWRYLKVYGCVEHALSAKKKRKYDHCHNDEISGNMIPFIKSKSQRIIDAADQDLDTFKFVVQSTLHSTSDFEPASMEDEIAAENILSDMASHPVAVNVPYHAYDYNYSIL